MSFLFSPRGYVQIFRNKLVIQLPAEGRSVVKEATFSHPRMVIGDFAAAEQALQAGLKEIWPSRLLQARPKIIMHPREIIEGGVTMIEERVLQELGLGAGARQVKVWVGPELTQDEVAAFGF